MKSIESRQDLEVLVHTFYAKIRKDDLLGDIFNNHILEEQWSAHLEKLTNFWERILLGGDNFRGNPSQKHINVDSNLNYTVSQEHFGRWLMLWFQTVDELYDCDIAFMAKETARKMAHGQYITIWNHRPQEFK